MISKILRTSVVLLVAFVFVPVSHAAERMVSATSAPSAPKDKSGTMASASVATPAADSSAAATPAVVPAPAIATPAAPALKPIVITFGGEISAVDIKTTPGMVTVKDRYNVTKEMKVPADAKITEGAVAKTLSDLKVGSKVTVEYTYDVAKGDRTVQSISLSEPAAPAAPAGS